MVYKTLVTRGHSGGLYVFVVSVAKELDLKKAAKAVGEKSVEMIRVDEINKYTAVVQIVGNVLFDKIKVLYAAEDYHSDEASCEEARSRFMAAFEEKPLCEMKPEPHAWQPLLKEITQVCCRLCGQLYSEDCAA